MMAFGAELVAVSLQRLIGFLLPASHKHRNACNIHACKQMHTHTTCTEMHTMHKHICIHIHAQKCTHTCEHIRTLWSYACTSVTSSGSSLKIIQWLKLKGLVLKNGHTRELLFPLWLFKGTTLITTAACPMLTMVSLFIFNSQWMSEGILFLNSIYIERSDTQR